LVGFFRDRNSFHIVALVFIAILAKLAYLLHPPVITYEAGAGLLPAWLNDWYRNGGSPGFSAFIALLIHIGCAVYANTVVMNQRMFPKSSFLVALSMLLLSSLVPEANLLTAPLLLLPLLIFIYTQCAALYNSSLPRTIIYNIGFATGVGTILYHPFAIFIIAAMGAVIIMRTFRIQEWLLLLLGILSPYYLYLSWQFIKGNWHPQEHIPYFQLSVQHISKDVYSLIAGGLILLWTIIGFYCWQPNLRRMLIQPRKNWRILLLMAILCSGLLFLKTSDGTDNFALAVFPFGCFAASAFIFPKKLLWPSLLFWVIVFITIVTCLRHYEGSLM
jgi:hypothetical protein